MEVKFIARYCIIVAKIPKSTTCMKNLRASPHHPGTVCCLKLGFNMSMCPLNLFKMLSLDHF